MKPCSYRGKVHLGSLENLLIFLNNSNVPWKLHIEWYDKQSYRQKSSEMMMEDTQDIRGKKLHESVTQLSNPSVEILTNNQPYM